MAARRRVWSSLSADYRARLSRAGITREEYERGISLKSARGHAQTPESPAEYARKPGNFQKYSRGRRQYALKVEDMKRELFSNRIRYNEDRQIQYVRRGGDEVLPPTTAQLRLLAGMTLEEFEDFQYEHREDDDWRFLWYH